MAVTRRALSGGAAVAVTQGLPPSADDCFGKGTIRENGLEIHPSYLFEAKAPAEQAAVGPVRPGRDLARLTRRMPSGSRALTANRRSRRHPMMISHHAPPSDDFARDAERAGSPGA